MLDKKKTVTFDLDGAPVDSMWIWKSIDVEFLKTYGYRCPDDLQKVIGGMSFSETVAYFEERLTLPLTLDEIKHIWTEMSLDKYRHQVPLEHGVRELLQHVKHLGSSCEVATNDGQKMMGMAIEALHIGLYFQIVTTTCEVAAGRPEPGIHLEMADTPQVDPTGCPVFEDIPTGIPAGERAGVTVCAVEDTFSIGMREEKRKLAGYFINDYFDILNGVAE